MSIRPDVFAPLPGKPVEERHLVAALNYVAYIVVTYGDTYAPIFEGIEKQLIEFRQRQGPADRARRFMERIEASKDKPC